jgi:hypothetical protein
MTSAIKYLCIVFLIFSLMGCRAQNRYNWSNYDTKMYKHYKNPAEREAFIQELKEILDSAEPEGTVPPGIYAEYGYVMYEQGNNQQAVVYFQKEANKWPESRSFMTKLIGIANNRAKNQRENMQVPVGQEVDAGTNVPKPSTEVSK